jgi:hypothetical protein
MNKSVSWRMQIGIWQTLMEQASSHMAFSSLVHELGDVHGNTSHIAEITLDFLDDISVSTLCVNVNAGPSSRKKQHLQKFFNIGLQSVHVF